MTRDKIIAVLNDLIEDGRYIRDRLPPSSKESWSSFLTFRVRLSNLIGRACGKNSAHYCTLATLPDDDPKFATGYIAVAYAALADFEGDLLFDLRSLVRAELLDDFLDQCDALLDAGYHIPAASLAGAILEDTLRKIAISNDIEVSEKTKIDRLNADVAKAEVYDKLTQKQITTYADIRNNADHGHFDKFTENDVADMVRWVRRFSIDYLR